MMSKNIPYYQIKYKGIYFFDSIEFSFAKEIF
jgi:hypothetical protein